MGKIKYYADGRPISKKEDHALLLDLVRHHPRAKAKIGPGVDHFFVKNHGKHKCFWVCDVNGKIRDFSMDKCLDNYTYKRHDQPLELARQQEEKWAWLQGHEGYYAISNFGRVFSMKSDRCLSVNRYMKSTGAVNISVNGIKRTIDVAKECSKVFGYKPLDEEPTLTDVQIESILRAGIALPSYVKDPAAMSQEEEQRGEQKEKFQPVVRRKSRRNT